MGGNTEKQFSIGGNLIQALLGAGLLQLMYWACKEAYNIRVYAIEEFGRVIHEFDPYFNYRATVYLHENGWKAFSQWFDHMVWYPLGRPVGTTTYPGMMVTSVMIKKYFLKDWSINDICCFVPVWFGVLATLAVAWMTYEATRFNSTNVCVLHDIPFVRRAFSSFIKPAVTNVLQNWIEPIYGGKLSLGFRLPANAESEGSFNPWWTPVCCSVASALIMSILPAHLLRSIGGGYDNEAVAMTAMIMTFACWMTSLRDSRPDDEHALRKTTWCGVATGFAYFFMVATWGGYVFVLNLVGVHAGILVLLGRYSTKLHRAYTSFYLVGTSLAIQIPVVGWAPLRSLEQMGPLLVFGVFQLIEFCEVMKRRRSLNKREAWNLRFQVFAFCSVLGLAILFLLVNLGYFGPISSRVRGLFVKHTKTGNPLVDSVAEHQAAATEAYFQYIHIVCVLLPPGMSFLLLNGWNDASSFLAVFAAMAYYFSLKMVRLMILAAPIASSLGGIAIGKFVSWGIVNALLLWDNHSSVGTSGQDTEAERRDSAYENGYTTGSNSIRMAKRVTRSIGVLSYSVRAIRLVLTAVVLYYASPYAVMFRDMCHDFSKYISQSYPTVIQKLPTRTGETVFVDDYREAYEWLRKNTPEDARILAWWDYGYQIAGISNRTTLADGNTWNHEHVALLGRILTGPEKEAHRIARHLADYVLVWSGMSNDAEKSPHMRRIANSVYRGLCKEPTCGEFGFDKNYPMESMKESLVFKMVAHHKLPGVYPDSRLFTEVHKSENDFVKIYKILSVSRESKEWVERNRICDSPGSWYCPGRYPPALEEVLMEKRDFAQLEDFNRGAGDKEYTKRVLGKARAHDGEG